MDCAPILFASGRRMGCVAGRAARRQSAPMCRLTTGSDHRDLRDTGFVRESVFPAFISSGLTAFRPCGDDSRASSRPEARPAQAAIPRRRSHCESPRSVLHRLHPCADVLVPDFLVLATRPRLSMSFLRVSRLRAVCRLRPALL